MAKTNILFIFALFLTGLSVLSAQNETPALPFDSLTHKITFSEVMNVGDTASKQELYVRAREWFARTYNSSNSVIQYEDKEAGKIIGKAVMQVYHKVFGSNYPSGYIHYTVSIFLKDGRYRFEFTDFYHTGQDKIPDYGVCEKMINTTDKTMGVSYQKTYNYYLLQLDSNIKSIITSLKTAMNNKLKVDGW
jgi:hypothetical protein